MSTQLLKIISAEIEKYNNIDIQETNNYIIIISTKSDQNNLRIDYRSSTNSIWLSSTFYGAYQFHYNNSQWLDKDKNNLITIISNILKHEINNFQDQQFKKKLTEYISRNL